MFWKKLTERIYSGRKMIYNNILEAMGHTPIIRLNRMNDENSAEVIVKFEGLNVGGSIKTRTAFNMICEAATSEPASRWELATE